MELVGTCGLSRLSMFSNTLETLSLCQTLLIACLGFVFLTNISEMASVNCKTNALHLHL